jgi:hypothetical protein
VKLVEATFVVNDYFIATGALSKRPLFDKYFFTATLPATHWDWAFDFVIHCLLPPYPSAKSIVGHMLYKKDGASLIVIIFWLKLDVQTIW